MTNRMTFHPNRARSRSGPCRSASASVSVIRFPIPCGRHRASSRLRDRKPLIRAVRRRGRNGRFWVGEAMAMRSV
jgi:hypothetical protein